MSISSDVRFVLYFLAHDGIKNKQVWDQFFALNPNIGYIIYQYCENDEAYSSMITGGSPHHFASSKCCQMKTQWGNSSTVFVSQELLLESLKLFPKATNFSLVSGRCVPIQHPDFMLKNLHKKKSVFEIGNCNQIRILQGQVNYECYDFHPRKCPITNEDLYFKS